MAIKPGWSRPDTFISTISLDTRFALFWRRVGSSLKLTSRLRVVKRESHPLLVAAAATAITIICLGTVAALENDAEERSRVYAESLAAALANLAVEPLVKQDRIALGVLINRALDIPQVSGVQLFTIDNHILASVGSMHPGSSHTEAVVLDDVIMGYVRIALRPAAGGSAMRFAVMALAALLVVPPLAAGLCGWRLARAGNHAERPRNISVELPVADEEHLLIAVNLYNQIGLPPQRLAVELRRAREISGRVATLYGAQVSALSGTGLLLLFPGGPTRDRGLQVVCASFLLAELLARDGVVYRLGGHTVTLPAGGPLPSDIPQISDVARLSALAKGRSLVVSNCFPIGDADGLEYRTLPPHPLIDELATIAGGARLITGLSSVHRALIARQAQQLNRHWEATASESTF